MSNLKLELTADIGYDRLPLPRTLIVPVEKGRFLVFSYEQHKTDPLRVENITIAYSGGNRLSILMRGTGQLSISTLPDLKIGGSRIEIEGSVAVENHDLILPDLKLKSFRMANLSPPLEQLTVHLLNKNLVPELTEALQSTFRSALTEIRNELDQSRQLSFEVGSQTLHYRYTPGLEEITPKLSLTAEGVQINLVATFKPEIQQIGE